MKSPAGTWYRSLGALGPLLERMTFGRFRALDMKNVVVFALDDAWLCPFCE